MILLIILLLILSALALPRAIKKKSWVSFFIALILSFVGVVAPLFVFFLSSVMLPEWKGACRFGWLDCFITGKLVLAPLVLWATGSLYALEILRVENRTRRGLVIGIFLGAVTATFCFLFGVICLGNHFPEAFMLVVPLYVAVWYGVRAWQLICASPFELETYLITLAGSLPLWLGAGFWSKQLYESLPDKMPEGCFIVTAASRGHKKCVGPLMKITRHGQNRQANQQLLTFWQFENAWRSHAPRSHRLFRQGYNQIGPLVARQIRSPWQADMVYLALKPAEWLALLAIKPAHQKRTYL